ncbi:Glucose and ribitol dehydrogenase, partial [Linum perenne]
RVVKEFVNEYKTIDILVNNAAVQYYTYSIDDITESRLEKTFRTSIFAYIFMAKYSLKHMKSLSELLDYSLTKGANVTFTRSLALLLVERGILPVNGVPRVRFGLHCRWLLFLTGLDNLMRLPLMCFWLSKISLLISLAKSFIPIPMVVFLTNYNI